MSVRQSPVPKPVWYTMHVETQTLHQLHRWDILQLGCIPYPTAWAWQRELVRLRSLGAIEDTLLLLEHPPTITLGRAADRSNILASPDELAQLGITVVETDRGGDVTYHAPAQLVGYPILKLSRYGGNLLGYLRQIEEALIRTLASYGIAAGRIEGLTGVWLSARRPLLRDCALPYTPDADLDQKIAAIGVRLSASGVTSHGFALNVAPDLSGFRQIIPCGIRERGVTSMQAVLGSAPPLAEVATQVVAQLVELFQIEPNIDPCLDIEELVRSNHG